MLTELKLSNFRAFGSEVRIRFRPITVLIGKNNAGKSSIIKFLLMLQQSLDLHSESFLVPENGRVELGEFNDLKNRGYSKRQLKFSLQASDAVSIDYILAQHLESLKKGKTSPYGPRRYEIEATVSYGKKNLFRGSSRFSFWAEEEMILSESTKININSSFLDFGSATEYKAEEHSRAIIREYGLKSLAEQIAHGISHIKPVREELPRAIRIKTPRQDNYVGQIGQDALCRLREIQRSEDTGDKEKYKLLSQYLDRVLDIEQVSFNDVGRLSECTAKNKKTGAKTNIANFGFGVSQCLPIFVQGSVMAQGSTLMVEQPETQVHPTAQLDYGNFFADLWKRRGVCSIVETHSNNLLLRLRHLIAKGDGSLKPDDVSIAFFDIEGGRATIKNLDINQDGLIGDGLPMEFFGADIMEGLKLCAAKYERPGNDHK